ncbi:MAG: histidinol-phosphate transaminase [Planctomycetia bacterium]|nr:histidinol-phosphate transaminase [Planctomycetia bacterium]
MPYVRPNIAALAGYAPGEQPQGGKFIKLNTNENPYPASPAVTTAIEAALRNGLQRYPDPMATAFRLRAAQLFAAEVPGITPDWILCGNGSDDLLTILTRTFICEGELLRLPYPSYILYRTLAEIQGARAEEVRFGADWSLNDDFSAKAAGLKLAFLPNPNSPSGTYIAPERVLEIAERLPCPLVVDEAYVDFAATNCLSLVARSEKIIVTRTLSKSYALAGLRFGFAIAQPHLIRELIKVKDSYNVDALSIAGATAAIDDQAWLRENRRKVLGTREKLTAGMKALGFDAVPSQANFVWCPHPKLPVKPLYEQLKTSGVLVRYMNYPGWSDGLRISVGTDDQNEACLGLLRGMV